MDIKIKNILLSLNPQCDFSDPGWSHFELSETEFDSETYSILEKELLRLGCKHNGTKHFYTYHSAEPNLLKRLIDEQG